MTNKSNNKQIAMKKEERKIPARLTKSQIQHLRNLVDQHFQNGSSDGDYEEMNQDIEIALKASLNMDCIKQLNTMVKNGLIKNDEDVQREQRKYFEVN